MSPTYTLKMIKSGPNHWIAQIYISVNNFSLDVVAGGYSSREAIFNCIIDLKKKNCEENDPIKLIIQDIESIL